MLSVTSLWRQSLQTVCDELDQRIIDKATKQWRTRLRACIEAKGGTLSINFKDYFKMIVSVNASHFVKKNLRFYTNLSVGVSLILGHGVLHTNVKPTWTQCASSSQWFAELHRRNRHDPSASLMPSTQQLLLQPDCLENKEINTGCSRKNCTKFMHHSFATLHHSVMHF